MQHGGSYFESNDVVLRVHQRSLHGTFGGNRFTTLNVFGCRVLVRHTTAPVVSNKCNIAKQDYIFFGKPMKVLQQREVLRTEREATECKVLRTQKRIKGHGTQSASAFMGRLFTALLLCISTTTTCRSQQAQIPQMWKSAWQES